MHRLAREGTGDYPTVCERVDRVSRAAEILAHTIDRPLTLDQLAREFGMNRTKLAIGLNRAYGISVCRYWRHMRLRHARKCPRTSDLPVSDVATAVGYTSASSFSRAFVRELEPFRGIANATRGNTMEAKAKPYVKQWFKPHTLGARRTKPSLHRDGCPVTFPKFAAPKRRR